MATPAARKPLNVRRSIQEAVYNRLEVPNTTPNGLALNSGFVDYQDDEYDNSDHEQWVRMEVIRVGAGSWDRTMLQFTCYSRTGKDRYGAKLDKLIDVVMDAMRQERGVIQLKDYESDPSNPTTLTGEKIVVTNSNGKFGEPEEGPHNVVAPPGVKTMAITYLVAVFPDDYTSERWRAP